MFEWTTPGIASQETLWPHSVWGWEGAGFYTPAATLCGDRATLPPNLASSSITPPSEHAGSKSYHWMLLSCWISKIINESDSVGLFLTMVFENVKK